MTRLKNLALGGLAALAITGAASAAFAEQPGTFENRLNGATIGLPLGAAAPPGLYTGLETAYLGFPATGNGNQASVCGPTGTSPCHVFAVAQAVPLLWSTGWTFLGASYSVSAVVAFYDANVTQASTFGSNTLGGAAGCSAAFGCSGSVANVLVFANPLWNPIALSWNLGNGWFVSAGFNFMAPIGTNLSSFTNPDYWTLEPTFAISYLANNWVLSANMFWDFNTKSQGTCCIDALVNGHGPTILSNYQSGSSFYVDLTALYKVGKWEFGPVGYIQTQMGTDNPGTLLGVPITCGSLPFSPNFPINNGPNSCGKYFDAAIGGLIGYDFGPVDLQVWITDSVDHTNSIDGFSVWSRLGFRLWAPEAPKPMVAKN